MNSIDEDAELLGIDKELWERFRTQSWKETRMTQYRDRDLPKEREIPLERNLPHPRFVQGEFESITNPIDDREAFIRRKETLTKRWFEYYKRCEDKKQKLKIIDQYNKVALMRGNQR